MKKQKKWKKTIIKKHIYTNAETQDLIHLPTPKLPPNTLSTDISSVGVAFGVDQHFQTIWAAVYRCRVGCCFAVLQ